MYPDRAMVPYYYTVSIIEHKQATFHRPLENESARSNQKEKKTVRKFCQWTLISRLDATLSHFGESPKDAEGLDPSSHRYNPGAQQIPFDKKMNALSDHTLLCPSVVRVSKAQHRCKWNWLRCSGLLNGRRVYNSYATKRLIMALVIDMGIKVSDYVPNRDFARAYK
ncbi:hypothetical protein TNCV_3109501 [Trichonephila clavipes]|nr:hypothetical protein TNCV_3109501 [Trichonephila clavipes]